MEENQQQANQLIQQGNEYFSEKLWVKAASNYEQGATLYKPYRTFYLVVGECYFNARDYAASEAALRQLLDFSPEHDQGWWMLGQAVMAQNRFVEAEEFYDQAIALGATDVEPYFYGAQMKHLNDKKSEVLPLVEKAIEIRPNWLKYVTEDPILGKYLEDN